MSAEDREKHLFYALNSGGLYHSFLERLKPRVQRVVRKRFDRKTFCLCKLSMIILPFSSMYVAFVYASAFPQPP